MFSANDGQPAIHPGDVTAIILAAGLSQRHGPADKLLRNMDGKPLAMHIADTLTKIPFTERISVVASKNHELAALFSERHYTVVVNPDPAHGQGHSLSLGVRKALEKRQPKALLICLADMPFVSTEVIGSLIKALNTEATAVVCSTRGRITPPALFGNIHFDDLARLEGDTGAKTLLHSIPELLQLEVAPHYLRDFDTSKDFISP